MSKHSRVFLKSIFAGCLVGILFIGAMEIWALSNPNSSTARVPYSGHFVAGLVMIGLLSLYVLRRNTSASQKSSGIAVLALSSIGIAGIFYFLVFGVALVCCGAEGVNFVNSYLIAVVGAGLVIGYLIGVLNNRNENK